MSARQRAVDGWGLGTRLFVAQAAALAASVVTAGAVATIIGPPLFHTHLIESGHPPGTSELPHIEAAFLSAGALSLTVGLVIAVALALTVTWQVTRRIRGPLDKLTDAALRISHGGYSGRVHLSGGGPELATLGDSFNVMAERLDHVEDTRRRLLSDVAHEMRTPIATMNAQLEALADGITGWDEHALTLLEQQARRLTRLSLDLDDVSRAEEGRITLDVGLHPLATLVDDVAGSMRDRYLRKGVALNVSGDDVSAWVDPQRLGQIMTNLLGNALRHTPEGGRVSVTTERGPGRTAIITVKDSGEGMTAEQLSHIFERFYRGDTARVHDTAGSGIGLTIAKALAEAHGGHLSATSPGPGLGSTFVLTLPVAAPRVP